MRTSFLDYSMSVIVVARASGRSRRAEAGAPPRALRDARGGTAAEPPAGEVRRRRRRGDEELPPPRRPGGLRHARAHGADVLAPLPARRSAGQLRQHRRRIPRRPCATPSAGCRGSRPSCSATSTRTRSISCPNYDELAREPLGAAVAVPESARQRLLGDRRRHGDEHAARTTSARSSTPIVAMIDDPAIDVERLTQHVKGPDFPTGGIILGRDGNPRVLPLGPRPHRHARPRPHRGAARRQDARSSSTSFPTACARAATRA